MRFAWKPVHTVAAVSAGVAAAAIAIGVAVSGPAAGPTPAASSSSAPAGQTPTPTPAPTPKPRPTDFLTGGKVSGNEVIAVKIENIAAARPQVGLRQADIVFVEEVEGAQTRLIAVYHTAFPSRLGPVRSARSTDVRLLPLFGKPGLVYSGANRNVQGKIQRASIVPIERSTRDRRRVAPHNVFVDLERIAATTGAGRARDIGWTFATSDPRWQGAAKSSRPAATVGTDRFTFDRRDGRYLVRWRGQTYRDGDDGKLTVCDNVIVMAVRNRGDGNADVNGARSVLSETVGRGKVTVYRDGRRLTGTWSRASVSAPLRFTDSSGRDIPLAPGRTWVLLQG